LTLANADLEYIKNLRLNIIYPATGMSYVAGSAKMQYPLSSPFVPIADPVMGMWNLDLLESKFAHGMPGVSVLDSNKIKIRFRLKLDCSFIIGDNPSFVASGIRMCGAPVSTPVIVASPPQIIGAVQPYGTNIQFTGANLQVSECAQSDRMEVRITNQGAGTTSNQDYVFFDLPAGINYMGSYIAGANSPAAPNLTIIPLGGGGTRLSFKLNAGVLPNDFIEFSFLIGTDANLTCGNYNIQTRSVIEQGLYCSTTEEVCNNVTVQTGGSTFVLQVLKPEISYLPSSVDYINLGGGNFQLALYGSINNTSTVDSHAAGSNSLTIKFYCDYGTAPGIVDSDDNLFATYTTTANIPAGGTILLAGATCAEIFTITDCNKLFNIVWVIEQNSQIGTPQQQCLCEAYGGEIIHEDILPINWFNISAKAKGENNEIRWKVLENPLNLRYVVLNETANGEWTGIGEIAAKKVFAQETVEYFFTHKNPKNFEKYRLKSLDADGKETFSKEVNLRRSDKNEEIFVYPNPTSSLLNVLINEDAEVQISDLLGKEILKTTVKAEGENALNVAHLPAGTYIIRFLTATGLKAVKFSKE
jgi:hypothetical protein